MARQDYTLVVFDKDGKEQQDEHGDLGSQKVVSKMAGVTDVFIMSHGWMGDVFDAIRQYNGWTDQLMACKDDIAKLGTLRPGFKPLMVGYHWPSKPFGDESQIESFGMDGAMGGAMESSIGSSIGGAAPAFDPAADFSTRLGGTPAIHAAVSRVYAEIAASPNPDSMTAGLANAYKDLNSLMNLGAAGAGAPPDADRLDFDPVQIFTASQAADDATASFGSFGSALLSPLRTISFWTMKGRARQLGENAGASLLISLQDAASGRDVRFHLMGHSFGCIAMTAMLTGTHQSGRIPAPVHSVFLVQGAMSLWSFTPRIPMLVGIPGYFQATIRAKKVMGPLVTTQATNDRALCILYPIASGLVADASFGGLDLPLFGALGTFGAQGLDGTQKLEKMAGMQEQYGFEAGHVYNIQSDNVIKDGSGLSGAHSDIYHPEVGHVVWQAAMTAV